MKFTHPSYEQTQERCEFKSSYLGPATLPNISSFTTEISCQLPIPTSLVRSTLVPLSTVPSHSSLPPPGSAPRPDSTRPGDHAPSRRLGAVSSAATRHYQCQCSYWSRSVGHACPVLDGSNAPRGKLGPQRPVLTGRGSEGCWILD